MAPLHAYLEEAAEVLTFGRQVRAEGENFSEEQCRHALAFTTWHSLSSNGIARPDAAKLMAALVDDAATL